jgi:hypothetical protein
MTSEANEQEEAQEVIRMFREGSQKTKIVCFYVAVASLILVITVLALLGYLAD